MDAGAVVQWMLLQIEREACIYQDDVVDCIIKAGHEELLIENADRNQVLGKGVLAAFRKLPSDNVVWVKPDRYWRFRVDDRLGPINSA